MVEVKNRIEAVENKNKELEKEVANFKTILEKARSKAKINPTILSTNIEI